jgi:hypothetical protein
VPCNQVLSLAGLSALSGLAGLRVLDVQLWDLEGEGEGNVAPADALAVLARSHPALEEVRAGCVCAARCGVDVGEGVAEGRTSKANCR